VAVYVSIGKMPRPGHPHECRSADSASTAINSYLADLPMPAPIVLCRPFGARQRESGRVDGFAIGTHRNQPQSRDQSRVRKGVESAQFRLGELNVFRCVKQHTDHTIFTANAPDHALVTIDDHDIPDLSKGSTDANDKKGHRQFSRPIVISSNKVVGSRNAASRADGSGGRIEGKVRPDRAGQ
jgi:hypothetical protein